MTVMMAGTRICRGPLARNINRRISTIQRQTSTKSSGKPELVSFEQKKRVFLASSAPMFGFGFLDNFILIEAGGVIDSTLGVKFGLATMSAAALGQVVSDVCGVLGGGVVENGLAKLGFQPPNLHPNQLPQVRTLKVFAAVFGVALGCLVGAFPLLIHDFDASERARREEAVQQVLKEMLNPTEKDGDPILSLGQVEADQATIHLGQDHDKHLSFEIFDDRVDNSYRTSRRASIVFQCAKESKVVRFSGSDENLTIMCKFTWFVP